MAEALARGVLAVICDDGGAAEIVRDGADGIHVRPDDAATVRRELIGLVRDPARRTRASGREHVRRRFDAERSAEAVWALLRDVAAAR